MKNRDLLRENAEELAVLSEGEAVVKTYHCTTVNNGEYEGYVTVTDRRMILVETSARGRDFRKTELPLEAVGGIDCRFRHGSNAVKIAFGIVFVLICAGLCVVPSVHDFVRNWIDWIFYGGAGLSLILAIVLFCVRTPSLFVITIYSSYPMTKFLGYESSARESEQRIYIKPASDCQNMIRELGALVLDVRQFGIQVREKYLNRDEQKELRAERKEEEKRVSRETALENERQKRLDEKQRRDRLREQQRLEKECRKNSKRSGKTEEPDEKTEQYFDILNK